MYPLNIIIYAIVLIIMMFIIYRIKIPKELPEKKPVIAWLPKYSTTVKLSENLSSGETLSRHLSAFGFKLAKETPENITFSRGSVLGDISIRITKVNLKFDKPLSGHTGLVIEYGALAFFDTGDLWKFTNELKGKLE